DAIRRELPTKGAGLAPAALAAIDGGLGELEEQIGAIQKHGRRIDTTVRGMLSLSRFALDTPEPTPINELIEEYVRLALNGAEQGHRTLPPAALELDLAPEVGIVPVVPHDIGRVVLNLASNALYAVLDEPSPGRTPKVKVQSRDAGEAIEVRVSDNGPGIPEEILGRVFNPFFTTKPPGVGTGLGLSICQKIIQEQHRGELTIDSSPQEGTRVLVRLPKRDPAVQS
ncbi:MAG: HAMP domain-containing sensor histidine kinase, partial [Acidobacteriota bacterium]